MPAGRELVASRSRIRCPVRSEAALNARFDVYQMAAGAGVHNVRNRREVWKGGFTGNVSPPGVRAAAHAYLGRGGSVIPMEHRGKRPLIAWLELQSRVATTDEADTWLQRWPNANIGIVTGRISGLVVLDVDAVHGGAGSLAQLEIEHGPLPRTIESRTGGGGRHLYFSHPGEPVANRVGLRPGIDLRGDGGCVVAPPSVHPNGKRYAWAAGCSPDEASLAPLPHWLLRTLGAKRTGRPLPYWRNLVRAGVEEGERNARLASLAGHLLWHEVDPEVVLELLLAWNRVRCHPPLDDTEVAGVLNSITRLHLAERGAAR
jgi:hypothetical protein